MSEPTKEQIQWFGEQCGFKHNIPFPELAKRKDIPHPERFEKEQWYIPGIYCGSEPELDLNNLFKYAVPVFIAKVMAEQECSCDFAYAVLFKRWLQELELDIPNATGTLFKVLYKALGGKE